jgi:ubiquitin-activating enzyme E1
MSSYTTDLSKYDRQLRTFGIEATQKINNSVVYLIGLEGGLGTEVAKNLVLSGIKQLNLYDNSLVSKRDIEFGYFYDESMLNKKRTECLIPFLQELNPYTKINHFTDFNFEENSTVIICNIVLNMASNINLEARRFNCKTVYVFAKGAAGYVFVDALTNHIVYDLDGENIEPIEVTNILDDGKVFCNDHQFRHNDLIEFSNLKGDNIDFLIGTRFRVKDVTSNNFKLCLHTQDTENITIPENFHFVNGKVQRIREPTEFNHVSLTKQLYSTRFNIHGFDTDFSQKLIETFRIVDKFRNDNILPWSSEMDEHLKTFSDEFHPMIRSIGIELAPVNSILGGIASTEVIKLVTNKYSPISQFYTWHDFSICPNQKVESDNSSYLISYFGNEYMKKLADSNVLMVGCGALGCEWLKNLSLLDVGSKEGCIDITDPDHIELSNLCRQFLFRPHHVGESKSKTAVSSIQNINPNLNMNYYEKKVTNEDDMFTNKIFKGKNIVINALDNLNARKYVDNVCFERNLPLFESGTMGMKGNTQPVIPFLTETYSNSSDPEVEKEFPVCTIKNFPNSIQHTIHWARDYFELFNRGPINVNKFLEDPTFFDNLSLFEKNQAIKDINIFLDKNVEVQNVYDCLTWAFEMFTKEFNHNIKQLLHCFPSDHIVNGDIFWSQGKRCPHPLMNNGDEFDYVIDFVYATLNILCQIYEIYNDYTRDDVKDIISNFEIRNFNINSKIKIAKNDSELKEMNQTNSDDEIVLLPHLSKRYQRLIPQEFEKDDDTNWHIAWLNGASNCRALNYDITPVSHYETKGIAGKIIPAVATTTSTIVGLISFELLKYINECGLSDYRSWFYNMADNTAVSAEPIEAPMLNVGNTKVNSWVKFTYSQHGTLQDFIEKYENEWNIKIDMILQDSKIIHTGFMPADLNLNIIELFKNEHNIDLNNTIVSLTIIDEENDEENLLPNIILNYN